MILKAGRIRLPVVVVSYLPILLVFTVFAAPASQPISSGTGADRSSAIDGDKQDMLALVGNGGALCQGCDLRDTLVDDSSFCQYHQTPTIGHFERKNRYILPRV